MCSSRDSGNKSALVCFEAEWGEDRWVVVAAMATPDMTHPRGLWAGHAPRSAEALSFVSLSECASAVGVEGGV